MKEEREILVKQIFPQIRKICEDRGVTFTEVDLRWGINDEQKAEGKVLSICLEEIERCRPYFIGILGERYGWVPEEIPNKIIEKQDWLADQKSNSITALEIMHGVLNDSKMEKMSFFYFRDPIYIDELPPEYQLDLRESPTNEEIEKYGQKEAKKRAELRKQKLAELKDRIKYSPSKVSEYHSPSDLGQLVLDDFVKVIDEKYLEETKPDSLEQEALHHEVFAKERTKVYIPPFGYLNKLDEHVAGTSQPLVILGESGSGKSTLLSKWVLDYKQKNPGEPVVMHFIGSSADSTDWIKMLRRIMQELQNCFDIQQEIPDNKDELRLAFANLLSMTAAKGKVILIIDALNQLDDKDGAPDLVWLPPVIPENVRLLISTLPGRSLDNLKERNWNTLEVRPLDKTNRGKLIDDYLGQYRKKLATDLSDKIVKSPQAANPLYLRSLLEELRIYGDHFTLGKKLDWYLEAQNPEELFNRILGRWEEDYEKDRSGVVKDTMKYIWGSRKGLTEAELMRLLGDGDDNPLPAAYWIPFYLATEKSLVNRSGFIDFSHDYLRDAVKKRYISSEQEELETHRNLARYFAVQKISPRVMYEFPWQLSMAKQWELLHSLLSSPTAIGFIWYISEYDVKQYWVNIQNNSSFRIKDSYDLIVNKKLLQDNSYASMLYSLFFDTGNFDLALKICKDKEQICLRFDNLDELPKLFGDQANICAIQGNFDQAMELYKKEEAVCRKLGDLLNLQSSLNSQGVVYYYRGELDKAMELHQESERICRQLGNWNGLQASLTNKANIYELKGDSNKAMKLYNESEKICRQLGNLSALSNSFGNQGNIQQSKGNYDSAMKLYEKEEKICRQIGCLDGLQDSLGNQGALKSTIHKLEEAMELYKEQERICRQLGVLEPLSRSLGNQGIIYEKRWELDKAMELYKEQERICREIEHLDGLQTSLGSQGIIYMLKGELDKAMILYKEQEQICRQLDNLHYLQTCLGNQGIIFQKRGELDKAMKLHQESERICRQLGNQNGLQEALGSQAQIFKEKKNFDKAMELFQESERICRQIGNQNDLQKALGGQGQIYREIKDFDKAMKLFQESERICRHLNNLEDLQKALADQGHIYQDKMDFDKAMELYNEAEIICRQLGIQEDLHNLLWKQAFVLVNILKSLDANNETLGLYKQLEEISRELGDKAGLTLSFKSQIHIYLKNKDHVEVIDVCIKWEYLCRDTGDYENLVISLIQQSLIHFQSLNNPQKALELVEEAYLIAEKQGYSEYIMRLSAYLDEIRKSLE